MRVNGFQCDTCCTICEIDKLEGWIISYHYKTNKRMDYTERHFCSAKCLIAWAGKQLPALGEVVCTPAYQALHDAYTTVEVNQKDKYMSQFQKEHGHEFGEISQ